MYAIIFDTIGEVESGRFESPRRAWVLECGPRQAQRLRVIIELRSVLIVEV